MLSELLQKIKRPKTIIPSATIVTLGFVWGYLDKLIPWNTKQELTTIYLIQWVSTSLIIIVALVAWIVSPWFVRKKDLKYQMNRSILLHVLKLRGTNQIASAQNIAKQINEDSGIILAHLNKLHNDQFVTFITGGLPPTQDTDFFLSPKALEIIKI